MTISQKGAFAEIPKTNFCLQKSLMFDWGFNSSLFDSGTNVLALSTCGDNIQPDDFRAVK